MANPQLEDGYLAIARELQDAIMQTKFTRRQRFVLDLIIRLSYGCGKKDCIIPKQKDFEIIGIGQSNIKAEIIHLIEANVIRRDEDRYWINKDYDRWRVSISGRDKRLRELIHLNLSNKNKKDNLLKQEETPYQNNKNKGNKLIKTRSDNLLKQEVEEDVTIDNHSEKDPSITAYNNNRTITEKYKEDKSDISLIFDHWNSKEKLTNHRELTGVRESAIRSKLKIYSINEIKEAIDNYFLVSKTPSCFYYAWSIEKFLKQGNTFDKYLKENFNIENHHDWKKSNKGDSNAPDDSKVPEFMPGVPDAD